MVGRKLIHGGHIHDTPRPLRQFLEQVAVSDVGKVGADLG
jgi:hypothetical protein